ncbi:MFS transporter [Bradyrhizobium sp. CAR08]
MQALTAWRRIACVFLPFAAGYYLSYVFRTINALIGGQLSSDIGLETADLGLLTSVYFLVFAAVQIPIGISLDRFGPRRIQSVLLLVAAAGAALFAVATGFLSLLIARAMLGLGVAAALMAGLKSIVLWFPKERVALLNGYMIMLGSLGAVTATAPAEYLLRWMNWRQLFEILAFATGATAILIYVVVPERIMGRSTIRNTLSSVLGDPRFWRIAPLSAACIGSAWSLQGLWASPWLTDVERFDHPRLVGQLFTMSIVLCGGAWSFGTLVHCIRQRRAGVEIIVAAIAGLFIAAQLSLILRLPLPSILPWSVIAIAGTATVVSFAAIAEYFPPELTGRANGALNVLHFGWAFVSQCGTGLILQQWPVVDGHRTVFAYQAAFGLNLVVQIAAFVWFALPWLGSFGRRMGSNPLRLPASVSDAVETFMPCEQLLVVMPANTDSEW